MMKEVWGYDLNKYGSFMLRTGLLLTTVLPESAGLTAADIGFGVVFLALYMLEMHILMCLALHGTPCFDSEGLIQLGSDAAGAVAEGVGAMAGTLACAGAPVDEATFAGWANADPKLATDLAWKVQAPCVPKPEPKEQKANSCKSEPDELIRRAKQMKLFLPGKLKRQATAVFRFQMSDGSCRDMIGNSNIPVQPSQISNFTEFERAAGQVLNHAEESAIHSAVNSQLYGFDGIPGLGFKRAIALGVSQKICDAGKDPPTKVASCRTLIISVGMQIRADQQSAIRR
ncbi:MAG: hypothetical protein U0175_04070 [Caldilineaceae bacterium]